MNNGNFIISRWNSYNADLALIPEDASALFDLYRDKTNILVFIDREDLGANNNFNMFLALNLAKDPNFNVAITTNHNAGVVERADVVINLFSSTSNRFNLDLKTYENDNRHFFDVNKFVDIKNVNGIRNFIESLKNGFELNIEVKSR
ncbi:hypothetical protein CMI43_00105 [Candidatus Pacearchaeota archaeon]|jgi:hypothetical protein|nr:hypothetical protein [Candidatus Pacearchaeota archaeon]|tara:strand:+ start:2966 stop:3406 length:441 start_codon:yes stop_codon:yes gene_type:complete